MVARVKENGIWHFIMIDKYGGKFLASPRFEHATVRSAGDITQLVASLN